MSTNQNNNTSQSNSTNFPAPDTGNASNPTPQETIHANSNNQLLDEKAEKYLREVASIEDMPDPQEQKEADEIIKEKSSD